MKTAVIALTRKGSDLALRMSSQLQVDVYLKKEFMPCNEKGSIYEVSIGNGDFRTLIGELFSSYEAMVFIMAAGIVVRSIAPFVQSKTKDPAVVVMDEKGQYCISLLSGHLGGANKLAEEIALKIGGTPVITTSTDVNRVIAFDVFAKENDCVIENIQDLKYISSELVNDGRAALFTDYEIKGSWPENIYRYDEGINPKCLVVLSNRSKIQAVGEKTLILRPRNLILGIGCRRGTTAQNIYSAVEDYLQRNGKSKLSIKCMATIDLKKDEEGLLEYCKEANLELKIISREAVEAVEGNYTNSDFAKSKVGVASVAEPCSALAGENARLVCKKAAYNGITLALAEEVKEFHL